MTCLVWFLLGDDGGDRDRGVYALPTTLVDGEGGEGFRIFDFEVDLQS